MPSTECWVPIFHQTFSAADGHETPFAEDFERALRDGVGEIRLVVKITSQDDDESDTAHLPTFPEEDGEEESEWPSGARCRRHE